MDGDGLSTIPAFRAEDTRVSAAGSLQEEETIGVQSGAERDICAGRIQIPIYPTIYICDYNTGHSRFRCRGAHFAIIDRRNRIVTDMFLLS